MLVEYFVQRYASRLGKNIRSIDKNTLELLRSYDWQGMQRSVMIKIGVIIEGTRQKARGRRQVGLLDRAKTQERRIRTCGHHGLQPTEIIYGLKIRKRKPNL